MFCFHHHHVGWGLLALLTALLAQSKGRSAVGWFILSLLLGPLALLLVVLVSRRRPRYDRPY